MNLVSQDNINIRWNEYVYANSIVCLGFESYWNSIPDNHPGWNELLNYIPKVWQRHHGTKHNCTICKQLTRERALDAKYGNV